MVQVDASPKGVAPDTGWFAVDLSRRTVLAGSAAVAASTLAAKPDMARAAAPKAGRQVPGAYRMAVGDIEVTALLDGYLDVGRDIMPTAEAGERDTLLRENFDGREQLRLDVNAYLVNTGDELVLIDTGTGDIFGPTLGKLPAQLEAAGIGPDRIDLIALTHMHPDHIGGMVTKEGDAVFPNAAVAVSETDQAFWTSEETLAALPDQFKGFVHQARAVSKAYGERMDLFSGAADIAPGISAVPLPGHTPGHTGMRISSGAAQLVIWGDIVHVPALQFDRPEWTIAFDVDPAEAAASRARILDELASDRVMVGGMHLWFPGFGHVAKQATGYRFHPARWRHEV
jgi:glyoxylase-like metal-dependent hydrolase (beta-lactamase superfamily II)